MIHYTPLEIRHLVKEWIYRLKYLKIFPINQRNNQFGIAMIDGRNWHGGMCDRFKGIISLYNYCLMKNIPFKIHYIYPFNLTDYLIPNNYNWKLDKDELHSFSIWNARPFIAIAETGRRLLELKTNKSILYYGNRDLSKYINNQLFVQNWGERFKCLFKPSELLQNALNDVKKQIDGKYVAAVYRFQNLLGDFDEYNSKSIDDAEYSNKLMIRALDELSNIKQLNPDKIILVTSDSITFLKAAAEFDYTYIIPGKIKHMDATSNDKEHAQLKSFLDFFMIAEAEKVYSVIINEMYPSEFPMYAAKINDIPFIRVVCKI